MGVLVDRAALGPVVLEGEALGYIFISVALSPGASKC